MYTYMHTKGVGKRKQTNDKTQRSIYNMRICLKGTFGVLHTIFIVAVL